MNTNNVVNLSLVIPCYNEAQRVRIMVEALERFIDVWKNDWEIIVVDDGSNDNTFQILSGNEFLANLVKEDRCKIVKLEINQGKGGAIKAGVELARGTHILTLDADMSTDPLEILNWQNKFSYDFNHREIIIASRAHNNSELIENPFRKFTGIIFNFFVRLISGLKIRDTQCGFKLYPSKIGKEVFRNLRTLGWAHDVEVLLRAKRAKVVIKEMPVKWIVNENSKVNVMVDSFRMLFQLLNISFYLKFKTPNKK